MKHLPIEVGSVVLSRAGRDQGRMFIVAQEIDGDFVMITDGGLRGMNRQKKKRRRHLKPTGAVVEAMRTRLANGEAVQDYEVRSWLSEEGDKLVQV